MRPRVAKCAFYLTAGVAGLDAAGAASLLFESTSAKRWAWVIAGVTVSVLLGIVEALFDVSGALSAPKAEPVREQREDS